MNEQERNEKLGRTVVGIGWFIFVFKFLVITSVIAGTVLYFLGKPLWIAPIIAVAVVYLNGFEDGVVFNESLYDRRSAFAF